MPFSNRMVQKRADPNLWFGMTKKHHEINQSMLWIQSFKRDNQFERCKKGQEIEFFAIPARKYQVSSQKGQSYVPIHYLIAYSNKLKLN